MKEFGIPKQFRSINILGRWVQGIFVVFAILSIIAVISGYAQAQLLSTIINGGTITESEAIANDTRQATIGYIQILLTIAAGVTFLVWVYRAHSNLPSLGAVGLRFTPGWAVGWFFVPVMSLFRPYQAVSEIWRASYLKIDRVNSTSWKDSANSSIIGCWWAFFLISNWVGLFAMRMIIGGEELSDLLNSTYAYMVSDGINVVGIIVTILMVRSISQLQQMKYQLVISS
jgi:hypothetical protein